MSYVYALCTVTGCLTHALCFSRFGNADADPTKISEFDWQKTILSIYNWRSKGQNLITFHELLETEDASAARFTPLLRCVCSYFCGVNLFSRKL